MKIAFSTLACPAWSVEDAAAAAAKHGFDGIEWRTADGHLLSPKTPPEVVRRIVDASREHDVEVACLDTSCTFVRPEHSCAAMVDMAVALGAPVIRVFGGRLPDGVTHDDVLGDAIAELRLVVDVAATAGVRVVVETHDDWASSAEIMRLARGAGAEVLWDVHHPLRIGEEPAETVDRLAGFIGHVHLKDAIRGADGTWTLVPLGDGELPLAHMVDLLADAGYDGYLSLEWEKLWHPELAEPENILPLAGDFLRGIRP